MRISSHVARLVFLVAGVAGFLTWMASNANIISTDGLRYIQQAKELDSGHLLTGLFGSIDHPAYPLAITAARRAIDAGWDPMGSQISAMVASIVAGALLVIPLYLVAVEMFGPSSAWLAVALSFLVPITGHVMGEAMSESLFFLFFFSAVWTSIRFLKHGRFGWLPPTVVLAALAYWVRPDALVLPAAMVATLATIPLLRSTRMLWPRWWAAVGFLVIGPACLIAPLIAAKGGISTKPAVMRVLGLGPQSAPVAVERARPLDPNQSTARTYLLATRAMAFAVRDAVTIPLLPLAVLGLILAWPPGERSRPWVFLTTLMALWALALIRLHATGGYCTPRHALILAYPLIASAAFGLERVLRAIAIPGRWLGQKDGMYRLGPIAWLGALAGLIFYYKADIQYPINNQFVGYRYAGGYILNNLAKQSRMVDLTGWSQFYGEHPADYTFANLHEAMGDRTIERLVVRDAHLQGPWDYCQRVKQLIGDRKPILTYPEHPEGKQSLVFIYDLATPPSQTAQSPSGERR